MQRNSLNPCTSTQAPLLLICKLKYGKVTLFSLPYQSKKCSKCSKLHSETRYLAFSLLLHGFLLLFARCHLNHDRNTFMQVKLSQSQPDLLIFWIHSSYKCQPHFLPQWSAALTHLCQVQLCGKIHSPRGLFHSGRMLTFPYFFLAWLSSAGLWQTGPFSDCPSWVLS